MLGRLTLTIIVRVSLMQRLSPRNAISLLLLVGALFFFSPGLPAQDKCNVEVKLLLRSAETQDAVKVLKAKNETVTHVYFFDTEALSLLSQGIIVRLRRSALSELTIKFRSPSGKELSTTIERGRDFKCEVDQTGEGTAISYSIRKSYRSEEFPKTGNEVFRLLSPAQKKFLNGAQVSIDWTRVKRLAEVTSSSWKAQARPQLGKLALELWDWSGGKILELSTKVSPEGAMSSHTKLKQLVETKHLSLSPMQQAKTSIVLQSVAHIAPQ